MRLRAATHAISVITLAGYLLAQATSRLTGSVVDPTGAAVPAATVDLFLPSGSRPVCIFSIIRGGFYEAFQEAPSGTCCALEAINSGSFGGAPLTRSQMYS